MRRPKGNHMGKNQEYTQEQGDYLCPACCVKEADSGNNMWVSYAICDTLYHIKCTDIRMVLYSLTEFFDCVFLDI